MTAFRFVTLTCDECGEIWDAQDYTIPEARRNARRGGWQYNPKRGDTCPKHHGYRRTPMGFYERDDRQ